VIRTPVAAGLFYPADPDELAGTVDSLLASARRRADGVLGLVAPHAGYTYSGPIAASAFARAPPSARVLLLGPAHFVLLHGMASTSADAWRTPLGDVPVADDLRRAAISAGAVVDDGPHVRDHALEVELPFLQRACTEGLDVLPVAVGRTTPADVADLIEAVDALVVVSTDLSHYFDHATARRLDRSTAEAIVACRPDAIGEDSACGVHALRGVVEHARRRGLQFDLLDLRTSADTAGDESSVVGYGAFALRGAV
jgi:AmmeMemoRadiSam system protein B